MNLVKLGIFLSDINLTFGMHLIQPHSSLHQILPIPIVSHVTAH